MGAPAVIIPDERPFDHQLLTRRLDAAQLSEPSLEVKRFARRVELDALEAAAPPSHGDEHEMPRCPRPGELAPATCRPACPAWAGPSAGGGCWVNVGIPKQVRRAK